VVVVAAGCSSEATTTIAEQTVPSTPLTTTAPETTSTEPARVEQAPTVTAPPLDSDGVARAVITETDVVMPVLTTLDVGYVVRTPCRSLALVTTGDVIDRVHVVLDPGHGGSEPGAVVDGVTEASLNLRVAQIALARLDSAGIHAVATRYGDERVPILSRVEIADRLGADLLVSIHHQGGGDVPAGPVPGTEVYYQRDSAPSRRLAGLLREEAVEELGGFTVPGWFAGPDAGATYRLDAETGDDFYGMVRRPETTAVLAEMSFMGNPAELELLGTRRFLVAEATAIADAVIRWYATSDAGSGFVEPSFELTSSGGGGGLGGCEDPDLGPTADLPADFDPASVGGDTDSG
jgi:N-acetylmuramoyl-L-alanine amidase